MDITAADVAALMHDYGDRWEILPVPHLGGWLAIRRRDTAERVLAGRGAAELRGRLEKADQEWPA